MENSYSDFVDHFKEKTKGAQCFVNWVDQWAWNQGYRIEFAGGIVPERHWLKDGLKRLVVRNTEVNMSLILPDTEDQLVAWIKNGIYWK